MLRLRFHGRGGQGAKVASRVLGTAAFLEGFYVQDFPLYGAERRGAPITAFTRISEDPIMERGVISEPDLVIVMDETLLRDPRAAPLSGLKRGGAVFLNTPRTPEEIGSEYGVTEKVLTLDITKICIEMLGRHTLSALAGAVASRVIGLERKALREAVEKELYEIVTDRELLDKNVEAALFCFDRLPALEIDTFSEAEKGSKVMAVPFEPALTSSPAINAIGNTPLRKTGNWRVYRPVWNRMACTKCMTCVARCPEGCISVDEEGFPTTDYENCKGCLICVEECPAAGIEKVREVHA